MCWHYRRSNCTSFRCSGTAGVTKSLFRGPRNQPASTAAMSFDVGPGVTATLRRAQPRRARPGVTQPPRTAPAAMLRSCIFVAKQWAPRRCGSGAGNCRYKPKDTSRRPAAHLMRMCTPWTAFPPISKRNSCSNASRAPHTTANRQSYRHRRRSRRCTHRKQPMQRYNRCQCRAVPTRIISGRRGRGSSPPLRPLLGRCCGTSVGTAPVRSTLPGQR